MFRRSHCCFFFPLGCPVIATPPCLPCAVDWDWSASLHSKLHARIHPVVGVGSSRSILLLILETRLPHSVMWCALGVCHHQCRRRRRTERTDSSGFFSRGCTVLPEGNGGESFRGPFRETRARTERIDADFWLDLCGEWTWHQRWHAKHASTWMPHACMRCCQTCVYVSAASGLTHLAVSVCQGPKLELHTGSVLKAFTWYAFNYFFSIHIHAGFAWASSVTVFFTKLLELFHSMNWLCLPDNWRTSQVGIDLYRYIFLFVVCLKCITVNSLMPVCYCKRCWDVYWHGFKANCQFMWRYLWYSTHNINSIIHNCLGLLLFLHFHRVNAI